MSFKAIFSGFETQEQAKAFLDWFEGLDEQDESLSIWMERVGIQYVNCDVKKGMIKHPDGVEYAVKLYKYDEQ
jgi:hypothetical protein